jgi:hypothetical protein
MHPYNHKLFHFYYRIQGLLPFAGSAISKTDLLKKKFIEKPAQKIYESTYAFFWLLNKTVVQ